MIAHELGHYYDKPKTDSENRQEREYRADCFAVALGLKAGLISAFEKMMDDMTARGNNTFTIECCQLRISRMTTE